MKPVSAWKRISSVVQWVVFIAFLGFVLSRGWKLWRTSDVPLSDLQWGWFLAGGPIILASWATCAWFWRFLIVAHGRPIPWIPALCAHYCGQLGKYVPGKGMVLLIRAGMIKPYGVPLAMGVVTATYETLLSMGAGLLVAFSLMPIVLPSLNLSALPDGSLLQTIVLHIGAKPLLASSGVIAAAFLLMPAISWIMNRLARKLVKLPHKEEQPALISEVVQTTDDEIDNAVEGIKHQHVNWRELSIGTIVLMGGWWVQSLGLGAVLLSIGVEPAGISDWMLWTMAYSLATVVGFLAIFAPGGLGVREAVLIEILRLQPGISNQQALTAAVLLRVLMFAIDVISGLVCYAVAQWYKKRLKLQNTNSQSLSTHKQLDCQLQPVSRS